MELLQKLELWSVPVLIFSAGIGDVIQYALKSNKSQLVDHVQDNNRFTNDIFSSCDSMRNTHIISNFMGWNDGGLFIGFKGKMIHTLNKNEHSIPSNSNYFEELKQRTSVILMGDSLTDLQMTEGMKHDVILKIGYLNNLLVGEDDRVENYMNSFDVVLVNDESTDFVHEFVNTIAGDSKSLQK